MLEEIFKKAKENGISKYALGKRVLSITNNIYSLNNPTNKTLNKLQKALDELIAEKNKKK